MGSEIVPLQWTAVSNSYWVIQGDAAIHRSSVYYSVVLFIIWGFLHLMYPELPLPVLG